VTNGGGGGGGGAVVGTLIANGSSNGVATTTTTSSAYASTSTAAAASSSTSTLANVLSTEVLNEREFVVESRSMSTELSAFLGSFEQSRKGERRQLCC
jgi:hypothetical protein